jgi:hypothetical protein
MDVFDAFRKGLARNGAQFSWLAIAALLWCSGSAALSPDLTVKELHHTAWGPSQGAPLGGALALAQTSDGTLWIAAGRAFARFDGTRWTTVDSQTGLRASTSSTTSPSRCRRHGPTSAWRNPAPGLFGWTWAPHWCRLPKIHRLGSPATSRTHRQKLNRGKHQ